jgi:hypothetical protein
MQVTTVAVLITIETGSFTSQGCEREKYLTGIEKLIAVVLKD